MIFILLTSFCQKKPLLLGPATVLEIFYYLRVYLKSPTFGPSYSTRNILPRFCLKSPTFGPTNSAWNILPSFCLKSPILGPSFSSRNILTRLTQKSPWQSQKAIVKIFLHIFAIPSSCRHEKLYVSNAFKTFLEISML